MKKIDIFPVLIVIILLQIYTVHGSELPISAGLKLYGTYADNVFQTASPESDYITLTYLDASYDISSAASLFYNTNVNLFSEHSDLRNHTHSLGADYERQVSQGKGVLYLAGKLGIRQNTPEYDPYDRRAGNAYAGLKYYLTESILAKTGYGIEYEDYPNYREFSFLENYSFLQLSKFFQSRTTLQLGMDVGLRGYPNLGSDNGKDYASQVTASAKLAQSLADNTGLQLQYSWHRASQDILDDQYLEGDYFSIEDFYEDDYSYSSREYRLTIKHLGFRGTMLKGTFSRESRDYNTPSIYIEDTTRTDSDTTLLLEIEKRLSLSLDSFPDLALHIQFLHRKNDSNDPYYKYSANIFSIGTKATF